MHAHSRLASLERLETRIPLTATLLADVNSAPPHLQVRDIAPFGDGIMVRSLRDELWYTDGTVESTRLVKSLPFISLGPELGDQMFFRSAGSELWVTDGTNSGTTLVKDIGTRLHTIRRLGDAAVFIGDDGETGSELWRSDGTADGTYMVREINIGPGGIGTLELTVVGNRVYFEAHDGIAPAQLWMSDGTAEGTQALTDFDEREGIDPGSIVAWGDRLFFSAQTREFGNELWISDGTREGTRQVADVLPNSRGSLRSSFPRELTMVGDRLFFVASGPSHGRELWSSDGTSAGTRLVADISPGSASTSLTDLSTYDGEAYFAANGDLWASDGTQQGTRLVSDEFRNPAGFADWQGQLYFISRPDPDDVINYARLIRWDGTNAGAVAVDGPDVFGRLTVLKPTPGGLFWNGDFSVWRVEDHTSSTFEMVSFNGELTEGSDPVKPVRLGDAWLFFATEGNRGVRSESLWRTDGTSENTYRISRRVRLQEGVVLGDKFVFFTESGAWTTDGTARSDVPLVEISSGDRLLLVGEAAGWAFFAIEGGENASNVPTFRLWGTDGTPEGTQKLADEIEIVELLLDASVYDTESTGTPSVTIVDRGGSVWETDGTREGTQRLFAIDAEGDIRHAQALRDGFIFFRVDRDDRRFGALWGSDGTSQGTSKLAEQLLISDLRIQAGIAYFPDEVGGISRLYRSDGTVAGTFALDVEEPRDFLVIGESLFAVGSEYIEADGINWDTLWHVDLVDGNRIALATAPDIEVVPVAETLLYFEISGNEGRDFWRTDGTREGTFEIAGDISINYHAGFIESQGYFYFFAFRASSEQTYLWRTDGTREGTVPAFDLMPNQSGRLHAIPDNLTGDDALLVSFGAQFRSTATLFRIVSDANRNHFATPLAVGRSVEPIAVSGDEILFSSEDRIIGRELFVYRSGPGLGDIDGDGEVTFADYLALSANMGAVDATFADGDFDGDGNVSMSDYWLLAASFGVSYRPVPLLEYDVGTVE